MCGPGLPIAKPVRDRILSGATFEILSKRSQSPQRIDLTTLYFSRLDQATAHRLIAKHQVLKVALGELAFNLVFLASVHCIKTLQLERCNYI